MAKKIIAKIKKSKEFWLIIGFGLLIIGQYSYWVGFHNFDSAQNFEGIELSTNLGLCEENISHYRLTLNDYELDYTLDSHFKNYIDGVRGNIFGLYISLLGVGIFAYNLKKQAGVK